MFRDSSYRSGVTDAPIMGDNSLFQTGQDDEYLVFPPIPSDLLSSTSHSLASASHPDQFSHQRAPPATTATTNGEHHRDWFSPSSQYYGSQYRDGTSPSIHASYMPAKASPGIFNDTRDPRQYIVQIPSASRSLNKDVWMPASPYSADSPHVPYSDKRNPPTSIYPHQYDAYPVQQNLYSHPTTVPDYQTVPLVPYNQPRYTETPHNQALYNQAPYSPEPVRIDTEPHSVAFVVLPPKDAVVSLGEPVNPVKFKRKKADPAQLEVLNKTYQRTAFPSAEEREQLAVELGMRPRSVQIWFQHKRQHDRKASRGRVARTAVNAKLCPN